MRTGEKIAAVLSALMNSGGGVLFVHLLKKARDIHDICLESCQKNIVQLITQQEKWIPEDVFADSINCTKNEAEKELYFFASKTEHMVTLHSNASYLKQSQPESIVDKNSMMDTLRECTCGSNTSCKEHEKLAIESQVLSMLPNQEGLNAHELFPVPEQNSETHLYRNYQLNGRTFSDVLSSQSVQCEILELVSALANTKGGSIFLGVTNAATPTVEGYSLTENDEKCTEQWISEILTGPETIWGNPQIKSAHYWKTFLHNVVGADHVKKVVEIHVKQCPGGMFYALPMCLDIRNSGEIYQLDSFAEWKKRFLHSATDSVKDQETDCYRKHFERKDMTDQDTTPELGIPPTRASMGVPKILKQAKSFPFCWWESGAGVVTESLQFYQCCSEELADSEMDISTAFSTFPPIEAVIERFNKIEHLEDSLNKILQEHQCHTGAAVFMENLSDITLPTYKILKKLTNEYHVFDLVILKERQPPAIVTIFKNECSRREADKYCLTLGQLLKKDCSKDMDSMKLFFRCQPYFIGHGFGNLHQDEFYPEDYLHPSTQTIDSVRYALARILLDCHHITDRYGNIMVRHLSSYQAKVLLGRIAKVLIVKSIAGSGKTILALEMARQIKKLHGNKRKIGFFCRSRGLAAFVQSQMKGIKVFEAVKECNSQTVTKLNTISFSQYTDIIIDDAHAIPVQGKSKTWQMYNALFSSLQKREGYAYIFLDPDMQDYRDCTPDDFVTQLEALAGQYVGTYNVETVPLGKNLRNSRRICQFMKACMGTAPPGELSNVRQIPEDGVFFHTIQGRGLSQHEPTTLLKRISNLKLYRRRNIAILTENLVDRTWVGDKLQKKYIPYETEWTNWDSQVSPVMNHLLVTTLENVKGLELPVIIFLLPQSWGSGYVESLRYRLCVATRATFRLELLLPWHPSERQQDLAELENAFSLEVGKLQ